MTDRDAVCLSCPLDECIEGHKDCKFVTITRIRRPYMANYYAEHQVTKLTAAKQRHEMLKDDPEYRELRRLREKERRRRLKNEQLLSIDR